MAQPTFLEQSNIKSTLNWPDSARLFSAQSLSSSFAFFSPCRSASVQLSIWKNTHRKTNGTTALSRPTSTISPVCRQSSTVCSVGNFRARTGTNHQWCFIRLFGCRYRQWAHHSFSRLTLGILILPIIIINGQERFALSPIHCARPVMD